jgi:hypothetical protein
MTYRTVFTQHAPRGSTFQPGAFDANIGRQVPFHSPGEPDQLATVVAAAVAEDGSKVELTLELPHPPAALTGPLTGYAVTGQTKPFAKMGPQQLKHLDANRTAATAALQNLTDAAREHRQNGPECDGFFCIGHEASELLTQYGRDELFMLLHVAINQIINLQREANPK